VGEREHLIRLDPHNPGYDEDYAAWLGEQVARMRAGHWTELDAANLIDEVESLGRSDFKGFVSAIEIVLVHMLKWDVQPERRGPSWVASIVEHRQRIADELEASPSYKARIDEAVLRAWRTARPAAAKETGLRLDAFPSENPFGWDDITQRNYETPDASPRTHFPDGAN
jgi:hypothetical protein